MDDQKQDNTFMPEQDEASSPNRFDSIAPTSRKSPSMAQSPNM